MPHFLCFLSGNSNFELLNKRIIVVGIVLGVIVTIAVIIGSPAFLGFDSMR
jgi:hypothetical protein